LEERYRIEESGGDTFLRVDLGMTDPQTFSAPYDWHFDFVLRPDWAIMDYDCVERPAQRAPGAVAE
jgi:hypothetical protein